MDGVHDMGGMHGFGPVPIEADDPVFRTRWEARVWALSGSVVRRSTVDRFRFTIEQMPPSAYLTSSYYERLLWAIERLAAEQGLLDGSGDPPTVDRPSSSTPPWKGYFAQGDAVRVANRVTAGHCRVPRYLRCHLGHVDRIACAWPNPGESASSGRYGAPELVYTVLFAGEELFGAGVDHVVAADLAESDLEAP
jgi:nitrile hydratase